MRRNQFDEFEDLLNKLKPLLKGWRIAAGGLDSVLLHEAKEAGQRAGRARRARNRRSEVGATATAVLCAAAACEARLSEYLAHYEAASGTLPDPLVRIRKQTNAREQWMVLLHHGAQQFNCGQSRAYLHLGCLFRLRDLVAHRNARLELVGSVPNQIEDCVRQRVIPVSDVQKATGWHTVLLVAAVADWAYKTAANWLRLVKKLIPQQC